MKERLQTLENNNNSRQVLNTSKSQVLAGRQFSHLSQEKPRLRIGKRYTDFLQGDEKLKYEKFNQNRRGSAIQV